MVLSKMKIPAAGLEVEIDKDVEGYLILNGEAFFVDAEVGHLLISMVDEINLLRDYTEEMEKHLGSRANA